MFVNKAVFFAFFYRPNLFDFQKLVGRPANENLAHAFTKAQNELGVSPLLEPEGEHYFFVYVNGNSFLLLTIKVVCNGICFYFVFKTLATFEIMLQMY